MAIFEILLLLLVLAAIVWIAVTFNLLVRDRNRVRQAWSDVEVQLLRRHELVPRLVETVKAYAAYERALLESLAELRSRSAAEHAPAPRAGVERALGSGLGRLIAIAESYPALRASEHFLDLQRQLADTENQIQFARRYYNGAVNALNTRIETFPDMVVANLFAFRQAELFDLDEPAAAAAPQVRIS